MKAKRWVTLVGAACLALATSTAVFGSRDATADPSKDSASKEKNKPEAEAPTAKTPIAISPAELTWGIDKKKLASIYDKVIDADFAERYKKVQPGPDMDALDAEVQREKDAFRRSDIDFEKPPTSVDATPLKGEYAYDNKEALMRITRAGKTRDFFFIQNRLWKVIDELPLGEKATWGKDFQEAVAKVAGAYGVAGRTRSPDTESGRNFSEVDWKDKTTAVRAIDWQSGKFGLVFQDVTVSHSSHARPH